jgi:hypothetical protein
MNLKKNFERYVRENLSGPGHRLVEKEFSGPRSNKILETLHYTTSCKHSLGLLKMGEIMARNMSSWLELIINHYCCI